jgi:hypothetical protein
MKHLSFSIVLYGESYLNKFEKYSLYTLKKNIDKINNDNLFLTFLVSTNKKLKKKIQLLIKKFFKNFKHNILYDHDLEKIQNKKILYQDIGEIQNNHLIKSKNIKSKYLIFIYSDIIYSNNTFFHSLKILENNNKISAVGSFALALNINKKFKNFFKKLLSNKNYLEYFIKNLDDLVSNFHKKFFLVNTINTRSNLIILKKKSGLVIKSKHYHPIIIKLNRIKNNKIFTLDSSFYNFFSSTNEIYIEKNMHLISIFSFDNVNSIRNKIFFFNHQQFKNKNELKKIYLIDLYYNLIGNIKIFNFFLDNYIFLNISKNLKIISLNKFINYVLKKKINEMKNSLDYKGYIFKNYINKISLRDFFIYYFINFIKNNFLAGNQLLLKKLNYFFKYGKINNELTDYETQSLDIFYSYFRIKFISYNLLNKIKFIILLIKKK